jgi:hypothetical protein
MENITAWRTSTRSQGQGQCVEVGVRPELIAVRDTKNREAGYFTVAPQQWCAFVTGVKRGDFDC